MLDEPVGSSKYLSSIGSDRPDQFLFSRFRRFKSKPSSSPPSTPAAPTSNGVIKDSSSTRNVITAPSLERKRTAPANIGKDLPPSKRISTSHSHSDEKKHERGSSAKAKQVDDSAASSTKTVPTQLAASPRFIPQPIRPPSPLSSTSTRPSRQRQPPSVVIKRPLAPAVAPSQTKTESTERLPTSATATNISVSKSTLLPVELSNLEDENQLLTLNEPSNFVDTFALIDEALLEADHLLELI